MTEVKARRVRAALEAVLAEIDETEERELQMLAVVIHVATAAFLGPPAALERLFAATAPLALVAKQELDQLDRMMPGMEAQN